MTKSEKKRFYSTFSESFERMSLYYCAITYVSKDNEQVPKIHEALFYTVEDRKRFFEDTVMEILTEHKIQAEPNGDHVHLVEKHLDGEVFLLDVPNWGWRLLITERSCYAERPVFIKWFSSYEDADAHLCLELWTKLKESNWVTAGEVLSDKGFVLRKVVDACFRDDSGDCYVNWKIELL